jgi:hypothetical protein
VDIQWDPLESAPVIPDMFYSGLRDGRITAETCRLDVINITYLYHLRIVVLWTVHTILFNVTQWDGLYQYCSADQMEKNEMSGACSMYGGE